MDRAALIRDETCLALRQELETTHQVVGGLPEDARDFRPHRSFRPAAALAWHLLSRQVQMLEEFLEGQGYAAKDRYEEIPTSFAEMLRWHRARLAELLPRVEAAEPALLEKPVLYQGGFSWPNWRFLPFVDKHAVHHRGELSGYLKGLNRPLPDFYGPDEPRPAEKG